MDKQINVKFSGGREGMHCARTWDEKLEIHGLRACCNVYNVEADTC
jgi:hypothetical protein